MIRQLREFFSPEQRRIVGAEAQQLLDNPHFKQAWESLDDDLNRVALACDPDNKDKAARIIISKQLLQELRQQFIRKVEDGYVAQAEMDAETARNKPLRFIR